MSRIGRKTLDCTGDLLLGLLHENEEQINEAYLKADTDELAVGLKVKFKPSARGNDIKVSLEFIKEKVKDKASGSVDEEQLVMFDNVVRIRDFRGPVGRPTIYGLYGNIQR